jgi:16S rRNA (cytosine967-C5)-methyltransferase
MGCRAEWGFRPADAATDHRTAGPDLQALAQTENRGILTEDFGFGDLPVRDQAPSAGVIVLFLPKPTPNQRAARGARLVNGPALGCSGMLTAGAARASGPFGAKWSARCTPTDAPLAPLPAHVHNTPMTPSSRRAAAALVSAVLDDGRTLTDALIDTPIYDELEGRDRAFARAIASATLRRLGGIDLIIARFLTSPLPATAIVARAILRTGAAQLLAMGAAAHAAVSESVELANSLKQARGFAKLINAVLRRISELPPGTLDALPAGSDLPAWLFARWRAAHGDAIAAGIARALRHEPALDVSVKSDPSGWALRLGATLTPSGTLRIRDGRGVTTLDGFRDGAFWVQDEAASLPVKLLGDVAGLRVLDLCAAPGGKTLQLAARGAHVTALDVDEIRLDRVRDNLARTGLKAELICADARSWRPAHLFDAVLLDAPCTATGTLRRRPDAAWLRRPSDIAALRDTQIALLDGAIAMVRPGGAIVYAVCSLEPEEGESVVTAALAPGIVQRMPFAREALFGRDDLLSAQGDMFTAPALAQGEMDGFFAARLVRVEEPDAHPF